MQIIERKTRGDVHIWAIDGGIDRSTHDLFLAEMQKILAAGSGKVVLDFSRLTYISSLSLGTLVRVHSRFKKVGAGLKFANLHTNVTDILRFTRLDHVFDLYEDVEAAVRSFG
jgi:anti-anti-sigma factor